MMESKTVTQLHGILVDILGHDNFEMTENLTAADVDGWDSLSHVLIISKIESDFKIKFTLREINNLTDMKSLTDLIESKLKD